MKSIAKATRTRYSILIFSVFLSAVRTTHLYAMVALSKFFVEHISWRSCNELLHPGSCGRSSLINIGRFTWSNSKYYLPVVLPHLLKGMLRGFTMDLLQDTLVYYAQLIFGGLVNAILISTSICALRHVLGKFYLHTLLFVPAALGGAFTACLTSRVKQLQHTAIFQCVIESLLMQQGNFLTKALATSKTLQTLVFMCCSALILHGKQQRVHKGFWFLVPDAINTSSRDSAFSNCAHGELDCDLYVARGVRNYFLMGFVLDSFKYLVDYMKNGHKQLRLESTAWLSCYVGIYRAAHCYLKRNCHVGTNSDRHLLASFLGGFSYLLCPRLAILSYALLEAFRTLCASRTRTERSKKKQNYEYSDVMFPLALAYLIHTYVFYPKKITKLAGIIIDSTTANYAANINKRLHILAPIAMSSI